MKFSICVDMMFAKADFYDRFSLVHKAGIEAVEFWRWSDKNPEKVYDRLCENELSLSVFNLDSSDEKLSQALLKGILTAGRADELALAIEESTPVYRKLGASAMIVLIGETLEIPYEQHIENIFKCLMQAKITAEKNNVNLIVEPLNTIDRKNYFMPRIKEAAEIVRKVASPNIKLLFDIYHEQLMSGNLINSINANIDIIGHFHVADAPGRHEPGTGEINYPNVLRAIEDSPYSGYVGLEYRATHEDSKTLGFTKNIKRGNTL